MKGKGLVKGLGVTLRRFFQPNITEMYPEKAPALSARFHGELELDPEKCIACNMCVNACPNRVIELTSERDEETKKRRLTGYKIDQQYCLFCGLCTEACPTKAMSFSRRFELAKHKRDQIRIEGKRGESA